uniref:RNA polymerase II subunit B1 CTD phosphatase RPAP2 homolog n=1 Tax=Amblyomma maculatum TaxID=34609 RepID=G3MKI0_AMBMU
MDKMNSKPTPTSERKQAILKTIERRDSCKKRAAQVVEEMLESPLSEEWLLGVLHELSQQDYQDAVEERVILLLCGYPLCNKKIAELPKQKYHICVKTKKVYDITHRKQFCSNSCYRASTFLMAQLWDGPLWLRDEADSNTKYRIYREEEQSSQGVKKDGHGDEVDLGHRRLSKRDVEGAPDSKPGEILKPAKNVSPYVTSEALKKLAEDIDSITLDSTDKSRNIEESDPDDLDTNDAHERLRPCEDTRVTAVTLGQCKQVVRASETSNHQSKGSAFSQNQKAWQNALASEQARAAKISPSSSDAPGSPIERVKHALKEWITAETVAFLVGDGAARRFQLNNRTREEAVRVERYRMLYSKLCKRLDEEERAEEKLVASRLDSDDDDDVQVPVRPTAPVPTMKQLKQDSRLSELKVHEKHQDRFEKLDADVKRKQGASTGSRKMGNKLMKKKRNVETVNCADTCEREPVLPLVDSHAQNIHRRRIVLNWLKKVLPDLLDMLYMDLSEVSPYLTELVLTFRLSAENVTFRLETWTHLAAGVLIMLSRKCPALNSAIVMEESRKRFSLFLEDTAISLQEITHVVDDLLGS